MPLFAGDWLGPYEILGPIGKGGMGEVYRAKDTKLKREVAVKVLPQAFAHDSDRMARFQREAEVLASLNHPNIAHIYGIEELALVMELVPGETLKGPLPLETALNYARQIAEALEAAHEKRIVHRDLKPANIIVTPEGVVKVLDFGLAAVLRRAAHPEDSPTLTQATEPGIIMGTAAYMSPEQACGKAVDRQADIWSFGVVLFEMLTGKPLFGGETVAQTLADVLRAPIDLNRVPITTPAEIRELLRRCLNRDLRMRIHDIGDARVVLQEYSANPATEALPAPANRKPAWVAAAALMLFGSVAGFGWYRATRPVERPLVYLDVDLGPDVLLGSETGADVIISPDGARLVFVSKGRLFTRRLNQPKATELAGTEGANTPFFSPDGKWVAFFSSGKLKKLSVEGGLAITLCNAPNGKGGAWGEDHTIIATLSIVRGALMRIPDAGGAPQPLTKLTPEDYAHRWPQILPGGKAVLFTTSAVQGGFEAGNIEVVSLADRRRKTLHKGGTYGRYLPGSRGAGYLVYISKGRLFAVPFNPDTLEVNGTPAPVLEEVSYSPTSGEAQFDFSLDGTLVYPNGGANVTLQWLDGGGKLQQLPAKPGPYGQPSVSPDGKRVALSVASGSGFDIVTYDWQRDAMLKLTFGDGDFTHPAWSPDGRYVAFSGSSGIFWTRADGAGKPQRLTESKSLQWPGSFSPNGKRLAFSGFGAGTVDLLTVPIDSEGGGLRAGKPQGFLETTANELFPAFSPDGRWIAYQSLEEENFEIFVRAFPDTGGKWQISNGEAWFAIWSPNGRELFYRTKDQRIMVVSYTTKGDTFVPDKPRLWNSTRLADTNIYRNLDIHPDGKRFLALMPSEEHPRNQVTFLLNFSDEVRRRLATAK